MYTLYSINFEEKQQNNVTLTPETVIIKNHFYDPIYSYYFNDVVLHG